MGRSVYVPQEAVEVIYLAIDDWLPEPTCACDAEVFQGEGYGLTPEQHQAEFHAEDYYADAWDTLLEDVYQAVTTWCPEVTETDRWVGREGHIILETDTHEVGISEYCGLVAVFLLAKDLPDSIADAWADIAGDFPQRLSHIGTFSNGEAVYKRTVATYEG